jgi:hypothetical protein
MACGFPIWFRCCCENFHLIPLAGFDYDRLKMRSRRTFKIPTSATTPAVGKFFDSSKMHDHECCNDHDHRRHWDDLRSRSHNHLVLESPWIGLDVVGYYCKWRFHGGYEYHFGHIRSHCEFILKQNFTYSLSDRGYGHGNVGTLTVGYQFSTEWEAALSFYYKNWRANSGTHKAKLIFGNETLCTHAKLEKAEWEFWELAFNFSYRY